MIVGFDYAGKYNLKSVIWHYYKAKITTDRTINVLNSKIQKSGFFSLKKSAFISCKEFLEKFYLELTDPNIEFYASHSVTLSWDFYLPHYLTEIGEEDLIEKYDIQERRIKR